MGSLKQVLLFLTLVQGCLIFSVSAKPHTRHQEVKADPFSCPNDGFFPMSDGCSSSYYVCIDGVKYVQFCPGAAVFDPTSATCVSPDSPACVRTTVATTLPTTTPAPFKCTTNGFFPAGECSSSYYACIDGNLYPQTCPGGGIFVESTSSCVSSDKAPCKNPTTVATTTPTTTNPTTAPWTTLKPFTCPTDGAYADPSAICSNSYYFCVGGVAYPQVCPGSSIFDPVSKICISFISSSCFQTTARPTTPSTPSPTTPSPTTTSPTTPSPTTPPTTRTTPTTLKPFTCPSDGAFANPSSVCSSNYYVCISGIAYEQRCPGSSIFDPVLNICISPSSSTCFATPTPSTVAPTTVPTTTTSGPFKCPSPDGFFPLPGECSKNYYTCVNNVPYLQSCPGNFIFEPSTGKCTSPENAPCRGTTLTPTIQPSTPSPTTPSTITPSTTQTPTTQPTTVPTTSTTQVSTTTTATTTSTTAVPTEGPFFCPTKDGEYAKPGKCSNDYYVCSNGIAILTKCPGGLFFNPANKQCDYNYNIPGCN